MRRILILAFTLMWTFLPTGPATAVNPQAELEAMRRLAGTWKLNWEQSESQQPAMDALDIPWLIQKMAGLANIQITIEIQPSKSDGGPLRLRIVSENPIRSTSRIAFLDGISRPFTDPLGNQSMDSFSWQPESGLKKVRNLVLKSGKAARIQERWIVSDDLKKIISFETIWIEDKERTSVRRIMLKVSP
jgi:hypothetical protein